MLLLIFMLGTVGTPHTACASTHWSTVRPHPRNPAQLLLEDAGTVALARKRRSRWTITTILSGVEAPRWAPDGTLVFIKNGVLRRRDARGRQHALTSSKFTIDGFRFAGRFVVAWSDRHVHLGRWTNRLRAHAVPDDHLHVSNAIMDAAGVVYVTGTTGYRCGEMELLGQIKPNRQAFFASGDDAISRWLATGGLPGKSVAPQALFRADSDEYVIETLPSGQELIRTDDMLELRLGARILDRIEADGYGADTTRAIDGRWYRVNEAGLAQLDEFAWVPVPVTCR